MKTYKNLYEKVCSLHNLLVAYEKAKRGKSKNYLIIEFEKDLDKNLKALQFELIHFTYKPRPLKRFIVRDPKTRTIHSSAFRDRVIHHAIINIIGPIFEKIFIYDSYASRINKGTKPAVDRFDFFKKKVSKNGMLISSLDSGGGGEQCKK